ncbi:MAG: hypothetical protein ACRD0V_02295 [Acidimicrobiales bacterium]
MPSSAGAWSTGSKSAVTRVLDELACDGRRAGLEVDVGPAQAEDLAAAPARVG